MGNIHDVDENAPWRNDPLAKRAVMAAREWNIHHRKGKEAAKPQQIAVIDYGMILLEVRNQHTSHKKYKEDVLARRLDISPFDASNHRVAALAIARAIHSSGVNSENAFDGCEAVTAPHMATWARKTGLIPRKKRNPEATIQARARVRAAVENGKPIGRNQVAEEIGVHNSTVDIAIAFERGRLEGITEGEALTLNEQGKFTKAQIKHVEALMKKLQRDFKSQFKAAVETEVENRVKERKDALERAREACDRQRNSAFMDQKYWKRLIDNHKFPFTRTEYVDIQWVLRNEHAPQDRRDRATIAFEAKELQLAGKK